MQEDALILGHSISSVERALSPAPPLPPPLLFLVVSCLFETRNHLILIIGKLLWETFHLNIKIHGDWELYWIVWFLPFWRCSETYGGHAEPYSNPTTYYLKARRTKKGKQLCNLNGIQGHLTTQLRDHLHLSFTLQFLLGLIQMKSNLKQATTYMMQS